MTSQELKAALEARRDARALIEGVNHANPIIRSMYIKSRSEMVHEFAQLYMLGQDDLIPMILKLAEALENNGCQRYDRRERSCKSASPPKCPTCKALAKLEAWVKK